MQLSGARLASKQEIWEIWGKKSEIKSLKARLTSATRLSQGCCQITLMFHDLVVAKVVPIALTPSWKFSMLHWSEASTSTEIFQCYVNWFDEIIWWWHWKCFAKLERVWRKSQKFYCTGNGFKNFFLRSFHQRPINNINSVEVDNLKIEAALVICSILSVIQWEIEKWLFSETCFQI